jgi:hypothetical protein
MPDLNLVFDTDVGALKMLPKHEKWISIPTKLHTIFSLLPQLQVIYVYKFKCNAQKVILNIDLFIKQFAVSNNSFLKDGAVITSLDRRKREKHSVYVMQYTNVNVFLIYNPVFIR